MIRFAEPIGELVKGVCAFFVEHDVTAVVTAGFRERHRQTQGPGRANRVVFIPGDPTSGRAGKVGPVKGPGPRDVFSNDDPTIRVGTVRSLADWDRTLTLSVWGYDGDAPSDELAQLAAVTDLFEWTMRALSYVRLADILVGDVTFTVPGERAPAFGQELLVSLSLSHPLFDVPRETTAPAFTLAKKQVKQPTPP